MRRHRTESCAKAEVIVLDKGHGRHEDIGLSIEDGKTLLKSLQHQIVEAQAETFCASKSVCQGCRRRLRKKGTHAIRYRTVFGDISVNSPRYYRCRCKGRRPKTFSPLTELLPNHTTPELLWLETRWASLVSFGVSVDLLKPQGCSARWRKPERRDRAQPSPQSRPTHGRRVGG